MQSFWPRTISCFSPDDKNTSWIFILSLDKFVELHKPKKQMIWYMGKKWMAKYLKDEEIKFIEFNHNIKSWWK